MLLSCCMDEKRVINKKLICMWRNTQSPITSVKTVMILDCMWWEIYFQRWKTGFSEKGWQDLHFNIFWKIPLAFGSDTILCACTCVHRHTHMHAHTLFVSVAIDHCVTLMWNKKLKGSIQACLLGVYFDYVINISNLWSGFPDSQRSSPYKRWWTGCQSLPGFSWYNVSSVPGNNKTAIF